MLNEIHSITVYTLITDAQFTRGKKGSIFDLVIENYSIIVHDTLTLTLTSDLETPQDPPLRAHCAAPQRSSVNKSTPLSSLLLFERQERCSHCAR